MNIPKCQLYLISPLQVDGDFPTVLEKTLQAGSIAAFQFRVKDIDADAALQLAKPLQDICREQDVAFVVNDDVALAQKLGADGIHLGQSDEDIVSARNQLGNDVQIGITCHDSRHLAMEAGERGANYVAFGAFFPTETKVTQHRPEIEILSWWSTLMEIPCVAIGGITPANCMPLVKAGADFLAVSGSVWNCPEGPQHAVREFGQILQQ